MSGFSIDCEYLFRSKHAIEAWLSSQKNRAVLNALRDLVVTDEETDISSFNDFEFASILRFRPLLIEVSGHVVTMRVRVTGSNNSVAVNCSMLRSVSHELCFMMYLFTPKDVDLFTHAVLIGKAKKTVNVPAARPEPNDVVQMVKRAQDIKAEIAKLTEEYNELRKQIDAELGDL